MTKFLPSILVNFVLIVETSSKSDTISHALVSLIEQDFVPKVDILNFYIKCAEEPDRLNYFLDLAGATLAMLDNISVRFSAQQKLPTDSERHYCILGVDSLEAITFLFEDIFTKHFNIDGDVVIVLNTFQEHYYDTMVDIFQRSFRMSVVDVNVIVEPIPGIVEMFTFIPFSTYSCRSSIPVLLNRFIDFKWEGDVLFPNKINNLHGCPLVCATWEDEPYLKVLLDNKDREVFTGIEGKLLDYLATDMNFTVQLYILNSEQINASLDEKGLVFDQLFKNGTDFVIGALHYKPTSEDDYFMPSTSYYLSRICVVMSSRQDQYPPFGKLLFPFAPWLWLCTIIYFVAGILIILISRRLNSDKRDFIIGQKNQIPIVNMFNTALGGGVNMMPNRNFARFLLCLWMILWLVLRSGYQSALFHFIRMDLSLPPPESIEEVMAEDYRILLTPPVYDTLKSLPLIQNASHILNGSEIENFPMIPMIKEKIAILTPYEYFGFYIKQNRELSGEFHLPRDKVFTQYLSIYLKKSSILNVDINAAILKHSSFGLTRRWSKFYIEDKVRKGAMVSEQAKSMTIKEVLGPFQIFIFGVTISSIVFGIECCINKALNHFKRPRKLLRILSERIAF